MNTPITVHRLATPLLVAFCFTLACSADELPIQPSPVPAADELLQKFDADHNGQLSEQELHDALASLQSDRVQRDAEDAVAEELEFVRVIRDDRDTAQSLDTSIVSFQAADGTRVDLISAIHVGDKRYYGDLNRVFEEYDVVLYELIAPRGTRIPRGGRTGNHPVSHLQSAIKSMLDLSLQLEEIDYMAKHLVHADMSPQQFARTMKKRGESFWQVLFRMMTQASQQAANEHAPSDRDLIAALFAPDRDLRLKRILASQFENMESQISLFEGPDGSTIITERNKRALEVLKSEMTKNKHGRIAIFYGAAHMPDMAERLQNQFDMEPVRTRWLTAWDMSGK